MPAPAARAVLAAGAAVPRWAQLGCTLLAAGHLSMVLATGRFRGEHLLVDLLLGVCPWLGPQASRFALLGLPMWVTGLLFDNQGYWLHLRGPIHTGDLHALERALFPVGDGTAWSEWLAARTSTGLDLLCGFAYATYIVEFMGMAVFLYFRGSHRAATLAWSFLFANVIGMAVYLLYPAAPPWYIAAHGPGPADLFARASAAGAGRFDALLGISYFSSFYGRNPNVFGAMPSLHVAYPLMVCLAVWNRGTPWRVPTLLYTLLMGFSAVYLQHHYILDVLAGWVVAVVAFVAAEGVALRMNSLLFLGASRGRP